jgi:hypothetical protein
MPAFEGGFQKAVMFLVERADWSRPGRWYILRDLVRDRYRVEWCDVLKTWYVGRKRDRYEIVLGVNREELIKLTRMEYSQISMELDNGSIS